MAVRRARIGERGRSAAARFRAESFSAFASAERCDCLIGLVGGVFLDLSFRSRSLPLPWDFPF